MANPRTILVVDDDAVLAQTLSLLLRAHGYEVFTAFDGVQGRELYFNHPTDVVVTDLQMPEMTGFEMMRSIRSINPGVKTIYVSGALERFEKVVKAEKRRFDVASLLKPITMKALLDSMSAATGKSTSASATS
jgi:DNA-binding NtrC family response regulator